jgi:hypothetical protein
LFRSSLGTEHRGEPFGHTTIRSGRPTHCWDDRRTLAERWLKRLRSTRRTGGRLATSSAGGRGARRSASSRNHRSSAQSRSFGCRFRDLRMNPDRIGLKPIHHSAPPLSQERVQQTPLQARRGDEPFVVTLDLVKELTPPEDTRASNEPAQRDYRRPARPNRRGGGSGRMPVPFGGKDADRAARFPPAPTRNRASGCYRGLRSPRRHGWKPAWTNRELLNA